MWQNNIIFTLTATDALTKFKRNRFNSTAGAYFLVFKELKNINITNVAPLLWCSKITRRMRISEFRN